MILALDSSAITASAALYNDGRVVGEKFINNGLTHSQTLMPLVKALLDEHGLTPADIDAYAVAAGPGSFTGLRIGAACVKGMADVYNTPCIPVSTLETIAYTQIHFTGVICALMDARCEQFYTALFDCAVDGKISRRTPDAALSGGEIAVQLQETKGNIMLAGDGARFFKNSFAADMPVEIPIPDGDAVYQRASGAALAAAENMNRIPAGELVPVYLRVPQAERMLSAVNNKK